MVLLLCILQSQNVLYRYRAMIVHNHEFSFKPLPYTPNIVRLFVLVN